MMRDLVFACAACALVGCGLILDYSENDGGRDSGASSGDDGGGGLDAADLDAGPDPGADAVVCADADGDGYDSCEDCDDANPDVHPGAPLICGDGVHNACPGGAGDDPVCMGLGTFVSATGSDTNPGTRAEPVLTIHQGQANARTIARGVDIYVAQGSYSADITMEESHSILCGYEAGGWSRDPSSYISDISLGGPAGVTFPGGTTRDTVIEGCTLRGLGGVASSQTIAFMGGSSAAALDNVVYAGSNASGRSIGVIVYPEALTSAGMITPNTGAQPLVQGNEVNMGTSLNVWALNSQSRGISSWGTRVEIIDNEVLLADVLTIQRGIEVIESLPGTIVQGNRIRGRGQTNVALSLRVAGGYADVTHNDVFPGNCQRDCTAAVGEGSMATVRFANNVFIGGNSTWGSSLGLAFDFEGALGSSPDVLIHSNYLAGGAAGSPAAGLAWLSPAGSPSIAIGRVINNVVRGGGTAGWAMYESSASIDPVLLENNALFASSSTGGARLYHDEGSFPLLNLTAVNTLPESAGTNLQDDCSVVDPLPDGDHHLGAGSACIDAGSSVNVPADDFDYESRPRGAGPDIGPDEAD